MVPIRKGDGTTVVPDGIGQVRTGDGRVLFEDAIPDSEVNRILMDEGSGSVADDSLGDITVDLVGAGWDSADSFNGHITTYDGVDDYWTVDPFGYNNETEFTLVKWMRVGSHDGFAALWQSSPNDSETTPDDGIRVETRISDSEDIRVMLYDSGSETEAIDTDGSGGVYERNEFFMFSLAVDGGNCTLRTWDSNNSTPYATDSGSGDRGISEAPLIGMARGGNYIEGDVGEFRVFHEALTESQLVDVWEKTRP